MPSRCNLVSHLWRRARSVLRLTNRWVVFFILPRTVVNHIVLSYSDPEALNDFLHGSETIVSMREMKWTKTRMLDMGFIATENGFVIDVMRSLSCAHFSLGLAWLEGNFGLRVDAPWNPRPSLLSFILFLNGFLCLMSLLFDCTISSFSLPYLYRLIHKMRNANTNPSQLCVIPIILPLCRLSFRWFFTIWVLWTVFCSFPCPPPLFDGLYVSLSWWLLRAGLGAFGFCLSLSWVGVSVVGHWRPIGWFEWPLQLVLLYHWGE